MAANRNMQQKRKLRTRPNPNKQMLYVPCDCDTAGRPPAWVFDVLAERKLTGGWKIKKQGVCETCFQVKSINGTCGCV
jgi:hypothetical protein